VLEVRSFRLLSFLANRGSRERKERWRRAADRRGSRSRRRRHATGSSEDLLADIPALRASVEELRELSAEHPAGKIAARFPARSVSAASREEATKARYLS
jgi:hypothetical protein